MDQTRLREGPGQPPRIFVMGGQQIAGKIVSRPPLFRLFLVTDD